MTAGVVMPVSARVALESPVSSEMNEEDESPEADLDYLDEYDSEEERRQRKKRKVLIDTHHSYPTAIGIPCTANVLCPGCNQEQACGCSCHHPTASLHQGSRERQTLCLQM